MKFKDKMEYLENPHVKNFLDFLVTCCKPNGFNHQWRSYSKKFTGIIKGELWSCHSLIDAFEQYYWPAEDPISKSQIEFFDETSAVLDDLGNRLLVAINSGDKASAQQVCRLILRWGGVESKTHVAAKFKDPEFEIVSHLTEIKNCLDQIMQGGNIDFDNFPSYRRIDSGITKIYALIVPGFAIFDSRVGCALGILVSKFWLQNYGTLANLPEELRFLWGGDRDSRNPNLKGSRIFPAFSEVENNTRFDQNIQISWLLQELGERLLKLEIQKDLTASKLVRMLETSLFMIGYGTAKARDNIAAKKTKKAVPSYLNEVDQSSLDKLRDDLLQFKQLNPMFSGTKIMRHFYPRLVLVPRAQRNQLIVNSINLTLNAANTIWYSLHKEFRNVVEEVV